jgi:hypothetical protein
VPIPGNPTELASLQRGRPAHRGRGAAQKNAELQAQAGDVTAQTIRIREATESNWKVTKQWREAGEESYNFVENRQWDQKDLDYLKSQGRPAMTLNKCLPQIRLLSGMERQNREELRVFPREGSDTHDSDIMTGLVKYSLDENLAAFQLTRKSNDVYICGRGWIKTDISYDENINGDVIIRRRNPFQVFWDPMGDEWDGSDMAWVQDAPWLTEEQAKELWPEFEDQIKVGDWLSGSVPNMVGGIQTGDRHWEDKLFLDKETRRVRCLEHWYKKREIVMLAVNPATGDVMNAEDEKYQEQFGGNAQQAAMAAQSAGFQFIRRRMTVVRCATVLNWIITQDKPSPFKHNCLPLIPYIGIQYMGEPWGLVEYLKDPQRLINKSVSNTLNHHNRSANSGWLNQEGEGADTEVLTKFGSVAGVVINYKSVKPDRIEPARLDAAHMSLAQVGDQSIDETSLLNAELQGTGSQKTISGRAIEARQRGGMIGNEDFFDNQLLGDKLLGYQLISNIQQCYTRARIMRIMGAQAIRNPEDQMVKQFTIMQQEQQDELFKTIDRCLKAEYDYVVDRSPQSVTIRQEQFKMLMEAAKAYNVDGREVIPADIIVDKSDLPESDKAAIKANLEKIRQQDQMMKMAGAAGQQVQGLPQ